MKRFFVMSLILALLLGTMSVGFAMPIQEGSEKVTQKDHRMDPLTEEQLELKGKALESTLSGKKEVKNIVEVAKGQYVELERQGEALIFTLLGEFSDLKHNEIPEPDRLVDNVTVWRPDFNPDYYMDMLFGEGEGVVSMRTYYIEQSANRFAVDGYVTDWIGVSGPMADYDDDDWGPDGNNVWNFLNESADGWYDQMLSEGMSPSEINDYLSQFDVWDRYDYDGDGNFDEPDGYIDRLQSVHAGEGEEGGASSDAIWSHSWYAFYNKIGLEGPAGNLSGGLQIGDSNYWIGKYTIQPENGSVGVFAHEFAHDLGLPDLYDYTGENGTGFWTLMSSGSWLSDGTEDLGTMPSHLNVWEKFQLGWLNYEVAFAGEKSTHRLGPAEYNTKQAQGVFVVLPPKEVIDAIATPYSGSYFYYSGAGNNLDHIMYKEVTLPAASTLTAMVNIDIEYDWDYAYLVVSTDGGATWESVETNLSTTDNPNGQNFGHGITGWSGDTWIPLTANLSAYEGDVLIGFRYWTDAYVINKGFMVDDISITGQAFDDAESDMGWTFSGFRLSTGSESSWYNHYYVCEYRTYMGYDSTLEVGPYNFNNYTLNPKWVERFAYQDGLLIHYWDTSQENNNTGLHPGKGLLLPIDAHYEPLYTATGDPWRNRIQTYDATFTKTPTDGIDVLMYEGLPSPVASLPGVSEFNDTILHYSTEIPLNSVMHPNTGTIIKVVQEPYLKITNSQAPFMQILIMPVK